MTNAHLWAGALNLMVRYAETGCQQSGRQATCLIDRILETSELDPETSALFEQLSYRLAQRLRNPVSARVA